MDSQEFNEGIQSTLKSLGGEYVADHRLIKMFSELKTCMMCKHKKEEGHIIPSGGFDPSVEWAVHYSDTHGQPAEIYIQSLFLSVYRDKETDESIITKLLNR